MALERTLYEDRPQALVKHTFLQHYLPALINKIASTYNRFIYLDGFAGPWQAADEERFADTSFGIALNAMADAQRFQLGRGRDVQMVAHLVEKTPAAYRKLEELKSQYSTIDIHTYPGEFQSYFDQIRCAIGSSGFCFAFIDPKGISLDLALLQPLLNRPQTEVLINFMFDFVNRFVQHPNPGVVDTMNALIPGADWRGMLDLAKATGATSNEREAILVSAFQSGLRSKGNYRFVPSLVVQKALSDRTLYHLVFGTRHDEGLSVFRDSQLKALRAQAEIRTAKKDERRVNKSGQGSLFGGADSLPADPSSVAIERGRTGGVEYALKLIAGSSRGIRWRELWPSVLDEFTITRSDLAKAINSARKEGRLSAPSWPSERHTVPQDDQLLLGSKN